MNSRNPLLDAFIPWLKAERPIDWRGRFKREAILDLEIGFGNGELLVRSALAHPERDFVGLELKWALIRKALRNITRSKVTNVRLLKADARVALDRLFIAGSLSRVNAFFPDPWPKKRHAKHRLFSHDFLKVLNSRLVNDGKVRIITDYQPYVEWIRDQVPHTGFEVTCETMAPRFGTKYERKWHEMGQEEFNELNLFKREHVEIPLKEDRPLKTYHLEQFDPDRFEPMGQRGEIVVNFKEFLYDPKRHKGIVKVMVVEGNLTQHLWIEIGQKGDHWYLHPAKGWGIVPTDGVQRALDLVQKAAQKERQVPLR
jgi:tRNA (guanine-N7-)-methyltransferase